MTTTPDPPNAILRFSTSGATLSVTGEVDASNAASLRAAIDELPAGDRTIVTEAVSFIDCAGLSSLIAAALESRRAGTRLVLRRPSRAVERIVELTGTGDLLSIVR